MVDVEFIRKKHFVAGWSIRQLSRQLELSRQTIRKALASSEVPRDPLGQPRPCPTMDPYRVLIEGWLAADGEAPPKQRQTAKRIDDRLVGEHQCNGGESTVRRYGARLRAKPPEVFIPLTASPGQQAQVDWGQAQVKIAGVPVVAPLFCVRLRASGVPFAWAAPTEKLEAFLDGHCRAFPWLGGVPAECLYDNPKTAVVRILAGPAREEHTFFRSLRAHYLFESLFCRPAQAHEKGSVENLVGYVRRNALVPVPDFPSGDALNAHLLQWCEAAKVKHAREGEQERAQLRLLPPHPFRPARLHLALVNRLSLMTVDRNQYSVPCAYVGRTVQVALFTEWLELSDEDTLLATHTRCYQRGQTFLPLAHYLPALETKPHAVSHAALITQLPAGFATVRDRLIRARPDGYREFAAILLLHRDFSVERLTIALEEARRRDCLPASAVRQILLNQSAPVPPPPIVVPAKLAHQDIPTPDLSQDNQLLVEVTR